MKGASISLTATENIICQMIQVKQII